MFKIKKLLMTRSNSAEKYIESFGDDLTEEQITMIKETYCYHSCLLHDATRDLFIAILRSIGL